LSEKTNYLGKIEQFLISITETNEYNVVKYLVFSMRKRYLAYLLSGRLNNFEIPSYLKPLVETVISKFNESDIPTNIMLEYMLENDIETWIRYYTDVFIIPASEGTMTNYIKNTQELFALVLTGYVLDSFRANRIDINEITKNEKLEHETNQYGLSKVENVEFKRDYFIIKEKAYMYNRLTETSVINLTDQVPGFAQVIESDIIDGDILLRLDERLALPKEQAIAYTTSKFDRFYGPSFNFKDSKFKKSKNIIVHMNCDTCDKLLMVVKQAYDEKCQKEFWHIEIETLPYVTGKEKYINLITTFLHAMYYPTDDSFTHIDYTKNQYSFNDYVKKYSESDNGIPIDFYTKKELHYKIWCIENGNYPRETWYKLMIASLPKKYHKLLDEMLIYKNV